MSESAATKALRKLTRQQRSATLLPSLFKELNDSPDRAVAILWGSVLENALRDLLRERMKNLNSREKEDLFGKNGALSTFASKILIGYAFDLFTKETKDDLFRIKEISNEFAHSIVSFSFSSTEVAAICRLLHNPADDELEILGGRQAVNPRALYTLACMNILCWWAPHVDDAKPFLQIAGFSLDIAGNVLPILGRRSDHGKKD